jgi:hypothetical protein
MSNISPTAIPPGDSTDSSDDEGALPFPAALARRDFLAPDFDAATYLSNLHAAGPAARHQTLEDLRAELRERAAAIGAELLALVNTEYTSFLGLGDELRGGQDRVADVQVALLGFRRQVGEVLSAVRERRSQVSRLSAEIADVRGAVETGRGMLELDDRVRSLERRLAVGSYGDKTKKETKPEENGRENGAEDDDEEEDVWAEGDDTDEDGEEDEDDHDIDFVGTGPAKLAVLARDYVLVEQLVESIGQDLPFVRKTQERMIRCRNTILLDLGTATKEARKAGPRGRNRLLKYLGIYRTLGADIEAVRLLKEK